MTDSERKLLIALVLMIDQFLDEHGDQVDSGSMRAGEHAIEAIAGFGLIEIANTRFGRWTEVGKHFRQQEAGIRDPAQADHFDGMKLVGKPESKE